MKYLNKFVLLSFLAVVLYSCSASKPASVNSGTMKETETWFKKGEWLNGLKLTPHPSINKAAFAKEYTANKALWDKAFVYLKETDLNSLKPGRIAIDGDNVYATVTDAPSKQLDKVNWESHRNYNDIHVMITGKEKIGGANVSDATVTVPYDATKDLANYTVEGKFNVADPTTFLIFTPSDAHRPNILEPGYDASNKKIVIKIRAAQ